MRIKKMQFNILDDLNIEIPALSEDAEGKLKGGFCSVKTFGLEAERSGMGSGCIGGSCSGSNCTGAIARVKAVSATNVLAMTVSETNVSVQIVLEINALVNIQQTRQTQLMKSQASLCSECRWYFSL